MSSRTRYRPVPAPDASGVVESRIAGVLFSCPWSLHGARVTIVWLDRLYSQTRDPMKGTVEDQARGMILELWQTLAARSREP